MTINERGDRLLKFAEKLTKITGDAFRITEAKEFQESILQSTNQHTHPYAITIGSTPFVMFPETFNPNYAKASLLLMSNLGIKKNDTVLDPFCGCGADAIWAVLGGAKKAVAIDKYTMPYLCTKYNAYQKGLEDRIDVRQGDLFDPLEKNEKFDLIIANPPFKDMTPIRNIEGALRDENYATLNRFWNEIDNYLAPEGRIRMVFADVGDWNTLFSLSEKNNFKHELVATDYYSAAVKIEVNEFTKK